MSIFICDSSLLNIKRVEPYVQREVKVMRKYDIMYILKPDLDDAARKAEMDKLHGLLTNSGAKITKVDERGLRDLAYPIKKEKRGYYVVLKIECASADATKEFDRLSKIDVNVLRFLITISQE
jgi:small subunit ribosomal protein S6